MIESLKGVSGYAYINAEKGGPAWRWQLELKTCQDLRRALGKEIEFSNELIEWGSAQKTRRDELISLSDATGGAELIRLPLLLPELYESLRPDQLAGVRYIASPGSNPYVCDQPGLGKTRQIIGGIFEEGMHTGAKLVIAPKTSLDTTWLAQLDQLQDQPVFVADEGRKSRDKLMDELMIMNDMEEPFWLVINPAMLTLKRKVFNPDELSTNEMDNYEFNFPFLHEIWWNVITVDEATKAALANTKSVTSKGIRYLNSTKRIAADGTPVRGKPINMWGVFNWLNPNEFKAKHRWADQWVEKKVTEYRVRGGHGEKKTSRSFGGIKAGDEAAFYKAHAQYVLRRTKAEVLPFLPPKMHQYEWVTMSPKQKAQYEKMEKESMMEALLEEDEYGNVPQSAVLTRMTRCKQFSFGLCDVEKTLDGKMLVTPTEDSPKLDKIMEILDELGITDPDYDNFDAHEKEQVIIASQFSRIANFIADYLDKQGIPTLRITGDVKRADRRDNQNAFQAGGKVRVMCMTTTAGGVAIDLDMANTVIVVDETWVPDDQEQLTDRAHRASRIHQVVVKWIRTKDSVEEDIDSANKTKQSINDVMLDKYREKVSYK